MIFINFKTHKESSGENAILLTSKISEVSESANIEIIACPRGVDLKGVVEASKGSVWAQHVDSQKKGRSTGWSLPEAVKGAGATGVLLNHSEHKLSVGVLSETLARCKKVGLKTLVFADSLEEAKIVAKFEPDFIGYEPPELVGSKETSVSKSKPTVIREVVEEISGIPIIVGAGVKSKEDVQTSLKLGARGVAVTSAVVLAEDQGKALEKLVEGFKS